MQEVASGQIKLHGFDELDRAFAKIKDEATKGALIKKSMSTAAAIVKNAAKQKVSKHSGELAQKIRMRYAKNKGHSVEYDIYVSKGEKDFPYYGFFLEYGTGVYGPLGRPFPVPKKDISTVMAFPGSPWGRGQSGGTVFSKRFLHPGMKAKPFMRPAFDENKERVINEFGRLFGQGIEKILSGGYSSGFGYSTIAGVT